MLPNWNQIKEKIGITAAASFIPQEGCIGLGSGSTAAYFIEALGKLDTQALLCIPTSQATAKLAEKSGLKLVQEKWDSMIDITCDGADYIDIQTGVAVKGLGGALVREKIAAQFSRRVLIMIDERKILYPNIQSHITIPVEIIPFGATRIENLIRQTLSSKYSINTSLRKDEKSGKYCITDNGNYTVDIQIDLFSDNLIEIHSLLSPLIGVVETGIFHIYTTDILIGYQDGSIEHRII